MITDIIQNLGILIVFSILSGFVAQKKIQPHYKSLIQGLIFGIATVIAMLNPYVFSDGLVFDGRSIMISIGSFFYGPLTAVITLIMAIPVRVYQGGSGAITGSLVIITSALIGLYFHLNYIHKDKVVSDKLVYFIGLIVHVVMLLLMLTLPESMGITVIQKIGWAVMIFYPLTELIIGKVMINQSQFLKTFEKHKEQDNQFNLVFENSIDPIVWVNGETGVIIKCNPAFLTLFHAREDQIIGQHYRTLHPQNKQDYYINLFKKSMITQKSFIPDVEIITKEDEIKYIDISSSVIEGETLTIHQGVFRDITELKKNQQILRNSEQRFRSVFEAVSMIGIILDKEANIIQCNKFLLDLTGWKRNEIINKNWFDIFIEGSKESIVFKEVYSRAVSQKDFPLQYQNKIITRTGKLLLIDWKNIIIYNEFREIDSLACFGIDITDRDYYEKQILQQKDELVRVNQELSLFNNAAINRELRMVELKEEINELCRSLNIPPRYDLEFAEKPYE